ncbi:apolipoprotein Db [Hemibagrus wyckioides]|uniref:apolipoprotein Db n=1 Tax=Hemibagrus wyckioides TaxID=337641 RepID=UPI00266B53EE|nr:apolipoprotein Db [Hemibagrus wyckioides]
MRLTGSQTDTVSTMKTLCVWTISLTLVIVVSSQVFHWGPCPTPMVQPNFDLNRYQGKWYEIEKLPATYEKGTCIETNYSLRPDKTIRVVYVRTRKGKVRTAEGTAVIQNQREAAKLGVSFSYFTPYSPYWVLSTDYDSVALLYSCTDVLRLFHVDYAWILSRSRSLPPETVYHAKEVFSREHIDISRMVPTDQHGCEGGA